ncbi:hypothetical protein D3C78_1553890 [compost metagenome]
MNELERLSTQTPETAQGKREQEKLTQQDEPANLAIVAVTGVVELAESLDRTNPHASLCE